MNIHEHLQEACLVVAESSGPIRKPPGMYGNMYSRNPALPFPVNI